MSAHHSSVIDPTDLGIAKELENKEFRTQFFRTELQVDVPEQIKSLRKMRGLKQEELAQLTGTKQSAISRLERSEEATYSLETLQRLADALDARLSVVIEPYEIVIARYRSEAAITEESGAVQSIRFVEVSIDSHTFKPKAAATATATVGEEKVFA